MTGWPDDCIQHYLDTWWLNDGKETLCLRATWRALPR